MRQIRVGASYKPGDQEHFSSMNYFGIIGYFEVLSRVFELI